MHWAVNDSDQPYVYIRRYRNLLMRQVEAPLSSPKRFGNVRKGHEAGAILARRLNNSAVPTH